MSYEFQKKFLIVEVNFFFRIDDRLINSDSRYINRFTRIAERFVLEIVSKINNEGQGSIKLRC